MPSTRATVVIPTLAADLTYLEAVRSLEAQSMRDFSVVVVDNSGKGLVPRDAAAHVIHNGRNAGFGGAINQGFALCPAPFLATLNDDAVAHPRWLESLIETMERRPRVGMCASQVRLTGTEGLDSAGMRMCLDGSSKQRGHGDREGTFGADADVLLPSASAALYRREMLEDVGAFDESFFLYCEDTDLGLRGVWAGWECAYVADAVVEHRYSHSAGRASSLKAYYVERNRLFLVLKNFPAGMLAAAPVHALARYFWHVWFGLQGRGTAAKFGREGNAAAQLPWFVLKAHGALLANLGRLWRQRGAVKRRISPAEFAALVRRHGISAREIAAL